MNTPLALALGLCAALLGAAPSAHAADARRLALLIANNEGGGGTDTLRYARHDAEKLGAVLTELGGYREADLYYLFDADADRARAALAEVEQRVRAARAEGAETTLLVYYSGHARDGALRMGHSRWPMAELRGLLARSQADVRIGVIDACQSGAITRSKGGRPGPSFLFDADDAEPTHGLVLITSSSDDEDSQESDALGGSYFTHYLASGLRGDADTSGDQRVTLSEVYGYAYHKTITQTVETRSGVQHPTYSYDLQGSGSLVMTELGRGKSGVYFGPTLAGDYLVFDRVREQVAAEIKKVPGQARRIALAPGSYVIKKRLPDHLRIEDFVLGEAHEHRVDDARMAKVDFEDDDTKGGRDDDLTPGLSARAAYQSHFSGATRRELIPPVLLVGGGVELDRVLGARLGLDLLLGSRGGAQLSLGELSLPYDFLEVVVGLELLWSLDLEVVPGLVATGGPRLAGVYLRREFPEQPTQAAQDHFTFAPMLSGGLGYTLSPVRLEVVGRVGVLPFSVDQNQALAFGELGLVLGVSL